MLAPQKKSYDEPRQHIKKKQRHYFANKGPSSQGYGFSIRVPDGRLMPVYLKDAWEWGWGEAGHNSLSTLHTVRHRRLDCPLLDLGAV